MIHVKLQITENIIETSLTNACGKTNPHREPRVNPTSAGQTRRNSKNAESKLTSLMDANFKKGDLHVVLTYKKEVDKELKSYEDANCDIHKFLRKLRSTFEKESLVFYHIHTLGVDDNGGLHHHLLIPNYDYKSVEKCWENSCENSGHVHFTAIRDDGEISNLAHYFIKNTQEAREKGFRIPKLWSSSRNLKKPFVHVTDINENLDLCCEPKPIKGYYILKEMTYRLAASGFIYLHYMMVKYPAHSARAADITSGDKNNLSHTEKLNLLIELCIRNICKCFKAG